MNTPITLRDYANTRNHVVLFYAGVGCPNGDYTLLGDPDWPTADDWELLDLKGETDANGDWQWNGEGNPTDYNGNTIYKLHAYSHESQWEKLQSDYDASY